MIAAGRCTACGKWVWRTAIAQKDLNGMTAGTMVILWPDPTSRYARVQTSTGDAPGIAYCQACAPALGTPFPDPPLMGCPIHAYDPAGVRYSAWYAPERREFYTAWLRDQLWLEPTDIQTLLTQWDQDRTHVTQDGGIHGKP